jgi:hypothetical protein
VDQNKQFKSASKLGQVESQLDEFSNINMPIIRQGIYVFFSVRRMSIFQPRLQAGMA